jgi:hypothetical protein
MAPDELTEKGRPDLATSSDVALLTALTTIGTAFTVASLVTLLVLSDDVSRWRTALWVASGIAMIAGAVTITLLVRAVARRREFLAQADALATADARDIDLSEAKDLIERAVRNGELTIATRLRKARRVAAERPSGGG